MTDYLLFDIETRPNQPMLDNLRHAYEIETNDDVEDQEMSKLTVEKVKSLIVRENPSVAWLEVHRLQEHEGKARKGVLDEIDRRADTLRNPIDKKWFTTPELQQVITVAWSKGPNAEIEVRQYEQDDDDTSDYGINYDEWLIDTLSDFWSLAKRAKICGWNSAGFDIPVLMQESRKLGTPYERYKIHSFAGVEHNMIDLMKIRFPRDWRGLRASAMAVGMPIEEDAVDTLVTGTNVARAYQDREYDKIATHCRVDIVRLQYLFRAYQGLYF